MYLTSSMISNSNPTAMYVWRIRFWNYRAISVVSGTYEKALAALTADQRRDVKSMTCRKVVNAI